MRVFNLLLLFLMVKCGFLRRCNSVGQPEVLLFWDAPLSCCLKRRWNFCIVPPLSFQPELCDSLTGCAMNWEFTATLTGPSSPNTARIDSSVSVSGTVSVSSSFFPRVLFCTGAQDPALRWASYFSCYPVTEQAQPFSPLHSCAPAHHTPTSAHFKD